MVSLLERARKINRLLQRSQSVEYDSISEVLSNVIAANVYIVDKVGHICGHAFVDDFECEIMMDHVTNRGEFPQHYVNWLSKRSETSSNLHTKAGKCAFANNTACIFDGKNTTIVPIYGVGERIGTLVLAKYNVEFTDDDLLLAEYGATVVGMEMLRDSSKKSEEDVRKKATVEVARETLSYSEIEAAIRIICASKHTDGLMVASKIADIKPKITRSVIVNALRKLESAGVIESRSLGMKGTYIKILNDYLNEYLFVSDMMTKEKIDLIQKKVAKFFEIEHLKELLKDKEQEGAKKEAAKIESNLSQLKGELEELESIN